MRRGGGGWKDTGDVEGIRAMRIIALQTLGQPTLPANNSHKSMSSHFVLTGACNKRGPGLFSNCMPEITAAPGAPP